MKECVLDLLLNAIELRQQMLNTIIIDDENKARSNLKNLLGHYCPQVSVLDDFGKPKEALEYLKSKPVDGIFLDIEMPGMTGFDFVDELNVKDCQVVFVTAYSQYAIQAFKANAIDYLLKPISISDLERSVLKMEERKREKSKELDSTYLMSLRNLVEGQKSGKTSSKITVPNTNGFKIIDSDEIVRISADGAYSHISFANSKSMLVTKNLGHFEEVLDQNKFVRTHYSHIINLDYLKEFSNIDNGTAIMEDGNKILIAKRRLKEFKDKVDAYYS